MNKYLLHTYDEWLQKLYRCFKTYIKEFDDNEFDDII